MLGLYSPLGRTLEQARVIVTKLLDSAGINHRTPAGAGPGSTGGRVFKGINYPCGGQMVYSLPEKILLMVGDDRWANGGWSRC